jgi:hypothetical protein
MQKNFKKIKKLDTLCQGVCRYVNQLHICDSGCASGRFILHLKGAALIAIDFQRTFLPKHMLLQLFVFIPIAGKFMDSKGMPGT